MQWMPPGRAQLLSEPIDCSQRPFPSILAQRGSLHAQEETLLWLRSNVAGVPTKRLNHPDRFVCCLGLLLFFQPTAAATATRIAANPRAAVNNAALAFSVGGPAAPPAPRLR